jgi:hypothetical protein
MREVKGRYCRRRRFPILARMYDDIRICRRKSSIDNVRLNFFFLCSPFLHYGRTVGTLFNTKNLYRRREF